MADSEYREDPEWVASHEATFTPDPEPCRHVGADPACDCPDEEPVVSLADQITNARMATDEAEDVAHDAMYEVVRQVLDAKAGSLPVRLVEAAQEAEQACAERRSLARAHFALTMEQRAIEHARRAMAHASN